MSTAFMTERKIIRRKGRIEESFHKTCDDGPRGYRKIGKNLFLISQSSDRRTRQIGKRHWLERQYEWFASSSGGYETKTIKPPGKKEQKLQKTWSF